MTPFTSSLATPIGSLRIFVDGDGRLLRIDFPGYPRTVLQATDDVRRCSKVSKQLGEYFAGKRRTFDLELAPSGTPFQLRVWDELRAIPFGSTISYAELARRIGKPTAVRAVGAANGQNPIPIVVPCHRVIGKDGSLTGFGGGLNCKRALLELEGIGVDGAGAHAGARTRVLPFAGAANA